MYPHTEVFFPANAGFNPLVLDLLRIWQHTVNVANNQSDLQCNTLPTISDKAGLELLQLWDLQVNMVCHNLQAVILDTGASLAITGAKTDFQPNTNWEVTSLKLGGMAAGATIAGMGDVAWTFSYNDGDVAIMYPPLTLAYAANKNSLINKITNQENIGETKRCFI